jgi:hypothetical protein
MGNRRFSPTGGLSPRLQVLSRIGSSVPSSLRIRADSMVRVSAGASDGASLTLKRIADVGNNKPADMYSRSFAAETGPIKTPAALKYYDKKNKQCGQKRWNGRLTLHSSENKSTFCLMHNPNFCSSLRRSMCKLPEPELGGGSRPSSDLPKFRKESGSKAESRLPRPRPQPPATVSAGPPRA